MIITEKLFLTSIFSCFFAAALLFFFSGLFYTEYITKNSLILKIEGQVSLFMKKQTLKTRWTGQINEKNVWKEYPRPTLVRESYINLNGYWDYAFRKQAKIPSEYDGKILVPFSPEAKLSGVERQLKPKEYLWYHRKLPAVRLKEKEHLLLHFGAVDQSCTIYLNKKEICCHKGGYLPFFVDITEAFSKEVSLSEPELWVMVTDKSDTSYHNRGKQKLKNGGMFYTAQSGIWQTVWMEIVPDNFIQYVKFTPDYDKKEVTVKVATKSACPVFLTLTLKSGIMTYTITSNQSYVIPVSEFHPWSPEHPFLYQVELTTSTDKVSSYFALRKCDIQTDGNGIRRLFLNNRPYIQTGVLDQGYWPDGLYTPPCEEAMIFDIMAIKKLGFNMIRKHLKIESERWYYACDRLGVLVWQDMVNGGTSYKHWFVTYLATLFNYSGIQVFDRPHSLFSRQHKAGRKEWFKEMVLTVRVLYHHPCIVCWVPFNEGWGQFRALQAVEFLRSLDRKRLIDHASGWFDQGGGDIKSIHYYFFSLILKPERRALALTEFGGYTWHVAGHSYSSKVFGYHAFKNRKSLTNGYERLMQEFILPAFKNGLSASVYTQLSDVEEEVNGIFTYDREVLKIDADIIREWNRKIRDCF